MLPNDRFGQKAKSSERANVVRFAPESGTYLPILELLPPPVFRERRHRGLARRLVAVRQRAVLVVAKGQHPHPRRTERRGVLPCNYGLA